jgi:hypothetical protein
LKAARWRILAWVSVALFAAYRLPELTRYSLWYDEVFSITLAQMGWVEMFGAAIRDRTNPPLFYALLKGWMAFGDSVAWMRLLPCLLGIATGPLIVSLARRTEKFSVAIVATAVGASSPLLVFLSNELRGYSLLLFLSALTMLAFARVVETIGWEEQLAAEGSAPNGRGDVAPERRRRVVLFGLSGLLLVYTHYFGWLLLATLLASAWFWARNMLGWLVAAVAGIGFMFVPWAASVWIASHGVAAPLANVDWIASPTLVDLSRFYDALVARVLSPETAWVGLLVLGAVGAGLLTMVRRREGLDAQRATALLVVATLPVLIAFAFGAATGRPVFVPRYLIVAAPAWWILIGLGAGAHGALALLVTAFTLTAGGLRQVRGGEKIPWDKVVAAVAADAGPAGGTLYSLEGFTGLPAAFYARSGVAPLRVQPVASLSTLLPPAWLVVRHAPADTLGVLGNGLTPRGLRFEKVWHSAVPSHGITAYRVLALPD